MEVSVSSDEVRLIGHKKAYIMGYLRIHPNFNTVKELEWDLGISSDNLIKHLGELQDMGYIQKRYLCQKGTWARNITGVDVLIYPTDIPEHNVLTVPYKTTNLANKYYVHFCECGEEVHVGQCYCHHCGKRLRWEYEDND